MITLHDTRSLRQTRPASVALWVAAGLLLIPVIVFWAVWASYAVNVPKWDDHVLKWFLLKFEEGPSLFEKIYQLFRQHNEHRIVYDRLVTWLDYSLFGKFSYVHLMAVGNLSLLGLVALFGVVLSRSKTLPITRQNGRSSVNWADGLLYLPPVAYLLLNLSQWENMFWGMAALQNFTVILWVVWTIYLLSFTRHVGAALVMAVVATLTSGNGLLVWPVGLILLLLQVVSRTQIRFTSVVIWLTGAVISVGLYFLHYIKPAGNPPNQASFTALVRGWLAFNGSAAEAFSIQPVVGSCVVLGGLCVVLMASICLYILKKWLERRTFAPFDLFFLGVAAFLIGTSVVVAWTRTGFGINTLLTSRYKLYSLLILSLLYSYLVSQLPRPAKPWVLRLGLAFSILLMASSYLTYLGDTVWLRQWLLTSESFNRTHLTNRGDVSLDSVTQRYLNLPSGFYDTALSTLYTATPSATVPVNVQKIPGGYTLTNTTLPAQGLGDNGNYLLLRSAKRIYLFPVRQNQQSIRRAFLKPTNLFSNGFWTSVSTEELSADRYQLFIFTISDKTPTLYATNQFLESTGPAQTTVIKNW